jgi:hypothetical protein
MTTLGPVSVTVYGMVTVFVTPKMSVALTVKVCVPGVDVSSVDG